MVTIGDVAGGRDNNFNLIRMIAALAVIVSHGWLLVEGQQADEPLEQTLGVTLGIVGVYVFFAISGFLITRSFDRRADPMNFLAARFLRLFPALFVVLILTVFLFGPIVSTLPPGAFLTRIETLTYIPRNLALVSMQYTLPGVFEGLPFPRAVNGTLWSLFYEVACYGMVFLIGMLGVLRSARLFGVFLTLYALFYIVVEVAAAHDIMQYHIRLFQRMSFPFVIGMGLHFWRDRIPLSYAAAAALTAIAVLAHGGPLFDQAFMLALCYAVFVLAFRPGGALRRYNDLGDYSYGLYIYGFSVQQVLVQQIPGLTPLGNIALTLPFALTLAVISWVVVERPALGAKDQLGARLNAAWAQMPWSRRTTQAE